MSLTKIVSGGRAVLVSAIAALGLLSLAPAANAVPMTFSYTGPPVPIPDSSGAGVPGPAATATIPVAGLATSITDVNFSIDGTACDTTSGSTTVGIDHPFANDLQISLTSPGATTVLLIDRIDGGGNNFCQVLLDDDAAAPSIQTAASAPFTGTWAPNLPLSAFDGQNPNGNWTVTAQDFFIADTGNIRAVSVTIDATAAVAPYPAAVLADAPRGYWRFGEASGTTLLDSSGNANHGTYLGGVTLGATGALVGDTDTAALYDGSNDQGRVPDANSLDVGSVFSAEGWIKRTSDAKSHELMNKGTNGIQLVVMNAASLNRVVLRRAGVSTIVQSTTGVPADGAYHHVVATMNGPNSAKIYIDGSLASGAPNAVQVTSNTAFPLTFGSFGSAPATPANYDEFALYGTELSAARVFAHYDAGT